MKSLGAPNLSGWGGALAALLLSAVLKRAAWFCGALVFFIFFLSLPRPLKFNDLIPALSVLFSLLCSAGTR